MTTPLSGTIQEGRTSSAKTWLSAVVGLLLVASSLLVMAAGPAHAGVGLGATPDWPLAVTVGQTGYSGSLDIPNRSNGGEAVGTVTLNQITLVPACGALASTDCPLASADPGVFRLAATGTGSLGGCPTTGFTINVVDAAQGKVQFLPSTPVVLGPPGSATDTCRINFLFDVLKAPTKDALPATAGVQTAQLGFAGGTHVTTLPGTGTGTDVTTVQLATPSLATQVTPATVNVGQTFTDTATITGALNAPVPTGTVTFVVYADGPAAAPCSGTAQTLAPATLAAGPSANPPTATATSPAVTATVAGTYRFTARYSGDANYLALADSACNGANENVIVRRVPSIATQVTPPGGTTAVGQSISDTAVVTGTQGGPVPTGTVTFTVNLDAAGAAPCSGPSQVLGPITLTAGPTSSPPTAVANSGSLIAALGTYRFRVAYSGDANYAALPITACNLPTENVAVTKAQPRIVTVASDTVVVGGTIGDTATLSAGATPTGSITFAIFGPDNATCTGTAVSSSTRTVTGNGVYTSEPYAPAAAGTYRFQATYGGDTNNLVAGPSACDDADEDVVVTAVAVTTTTAAPPALTPVPTPVRTEGPGPVQTLPRTGFGARGLTGAGLGAVLLGELLLVAGYWRRRITAP